MIEDEEPEALSGILLGAAIGCVLWAFILFAACAAWPTARSKTQRTELRACGLCHETKCWRTDA